MVDFASITRPVGRLIATAQNGLEVIRYGGLETITSKDLSDAPPLTMSKQSARRCDMSP